MGWDDAAFASWLLWAAVYSARMCWFFISVNVSSSRLCCSVIVAGPIIPCWIVGCYTLGMQWYGWGVLCYMRYGRCLCGS